MDIDLIILLKNARLVSIIRRLFETPNLYNLFYCNERALITCLVNIVNIFIKSFVSLINACPVTPIHMIS